VKLSPDDALRDLGPIADQGHPFHLRTPGMATADTVIGHFCGPGGCDEMTVGEWEALGHELDAVRRSLKPGEVIDIDERGRYVAVPA
jgi:hypothetical protein